MRKAQGSLIAFKAGHTHPRCNLNVIEPNMGTQDPKKQNL